MRDAPYYIVRVKSSKFIVYALRARLLVMGYCAAQTLQSPINS